MNTRDAVPVRGLDVEPELSASKLNAEYAKVNAKFARGELEGAEVAIECALGGT